MKRLSETLINGWRTSTACSRPARSRSVRSTGRSGFSLIEVILATAFLMGSAVVLARLAGMGREQSQKAQLHSEAQALCEQTLNELLLGLRPIDPVESAPLVPILLPADDTPAEEFRNEITSPLIEMPRTDTQSALSLENPKWRHSVRLAPLVNQPGMWCLTVAVAQADDTTARPIQFSLTRWISGPPPAGAFENMLIDENDRFSSQFGDGP